MKPLVVPKIGDLSLQPRQLNAVLSLKSVILSLECYFIKFIDTISLLIFTFFVLVIVFTAFWQWINKRICYIINFLAHFTFWSGSLLPLITNVSSLFSLSYPSSNSLVWFLWTILRTKIVGNSWRNAPVQISDSQPLSALLRITRPRAERSACRTARRGDVHAALNRKLSATTASFLLTWEAYLWRWSVAEWPWSVYVAFLSNKLYRTLTSAVSCRFARTKWPSL